ncbi:HD superfamily phosphohydrolase [Thermoplasmatales archaeon BRNA1]|nr:HD superfamily phosphohydrolase [Thermoplasmatales archaeon BRNA1]
MSRSERVKTVHDPVHGGITVDGFFLDILDRHEMQRLRGIKQLGYSNLIFPGANHTRFEHCLGTYHLAGKMAKAIGLTECDSMVVRTAALMHDICHAPFSHTLEGLMEESTGLDHMELARNLIMGKSRTYRKRDSDLFSDEPPICEILEDNGVDPVTVCDLIAFPETTDKENDELQMSLDGPVDHFPSKDYIHQIIHGPVDADQMDYLMRDAHYTGVVMGHIDVDRILATLRVINDRMCIERSGAPAAEGLMVSRSLMYSSVYFHQSVRIVNRMVVKAAEASGMDMSDLYLLDDSDLQQALLSCGGVSSRIMRLIQNRLFYRKALTVGTVDTDEDLALLLSKYTSRKKRAELEKDIADRAGIDESEVCVEMPSSSTLLSKIQIGKTDVSILDKDGKIRTLSKSSPIAKSLQSRDPFGWSVVVACPPEHRESVSKAATKILGI